MKAILLMVLCVSCSACCANQAGRNVDHVISNDVVSGLHVTKRMVHSGPYAAWELTLWRTVESDNDRDLSSAYLTCVGTDPIALSVHCKTLDSGMVYVAIDGLQSYFGAELKSQVCCYVNKEEYDSVAAEEVDVEILKKFGIEVSRKQFPLLRSRLED